ncbi:MAG: hypothetical protein JXR65_03060 [Bacteroidales bacterium]|nr:hypothetical protein [Bacteroidales bacterium]
MLLRFFKSGLPSRFLLLLFIFFVLRFPGLIHQPTQVSVADNIFLPWIYSFLPSSQVLHWIIAFIVLYFAGYLINYLATVSGLTGKSSSLTLFFFLLLCSLLPFSDPLNPYLFATLFIAIYFSLLFRIATATYPIRFSFDSGMILGVAALFFPALLYLAFFTWIALLIYQTSKWRNFVVSILGTLIPYSVIILLNLNTNHQNNLTHNFFPQLRHIFSFNDWHPVQLATIVFFSVLVLYISLQVLSSVRNRNIEIRQHVSVVFWAMILMFLIVVLFQSPPEAFVPLSIPASWLLASFFENAKNTKRAGWVVNGIFAVVVLFQIYFFYAA